MTAGSDAGLAGLAGIDTKLTRLTWMVGFNLILTVCVLWRLLSH